MFGLKSNITAITLCILGLGFSSIASAQEANKEEAQESVMLPDLAYVYDKDFCDFEISLPEEPKTSDLPPIIDDQGLKSEKISYVKVFDLDKSLKVTASCKGINKEIRVVISETTLDQEIKAIEEDRKLNIISKENKLIPEQRLRVASIIAQRADTPGEGIFVYQIWASDNSLFTLEAEVKGPAHPDIDKFFVAILKSFKK